MAGMFDYQDPEYVPGAGQGLSPLSLEAATKYAQDLARFGKGAVTGTFGALGDVESFGRGVRSAVNPQGSTVLNAFLAGMNQPTVLPTSSDVNKAINPYMPSFMAGEATAPQQIGEFASLGGLLTQAAKRVPSLVRATENAPVGLSIKSVQAAPKSGLGFYSAVEDAALNLQRNSGAGQAFLNDIKKGANVKDEEIKWLGLDEFLAGKKNVTKQEVQDYIANNRVDVQEVALGGGADVREKADIDYSEGRLTRDEYNQILASSGAPSKFGQYTLPGGENYREILLTMPVSGEDAQKLNEIANRLYGKPYTELMADTSDMAKMRLAVKREYKNLYGESGASAEGRGMYRSNHWDQPNVLAHLRVNDRVDADGKKMLLVEEVQSDWHQAGRDKGYTTGLEEKAYVDYIKDLEVRLKKDIISKLISNGATPETAEKLSRPLIKGFTEDPRRLANYFGEEAKQMQLNQARIAVSGAVPDAPFKDTWYQLALKRALQYAAENGYDRVGLTTGARQAERYDLSKQVDKVVWNKENGTLAAQRGGGDTGTIKYENVTEKNLADYIGKEAAKKLIDAKEMSGWRTLEGDDLRVGGEGMRKYYDEVYPKFLQKYGKKWDAKMGNTTIEADGAEPVRYIDITPKMKQSVTETGQPLFSAAAPIGTGALAYEEINRNNLENPLLDNELKD